MDDGGKVGTDSVALRITIKQLLASVCDTVAKRKESGSGFRPFLIALHILVALRRCRHRAVVSMPCHWPTGTTRRVDRTGSWYFDVAVLSANQFWRNLIDDLPIKPC